MSEGGEVVVVLRISRVPFDCGLNILRRVFSKIPRRDCLPGHEVHAVKKTADEKYPQQETNTAAVTAQISTYRVIWRIPRSRSFKSVEMGNRADCIEIVRG